MTQPRIEPWFIFNIDPLQFIFFFHFQIHMRISWKVHTLTKILSRNITKWGLFFSIALLQPIHFFHLHCPLWIPLEKKSHQLPICCYHINFSAYLHMFINDILKKLFSLCCLLFVVCFWKIMKNFSVLMMHLFFQLMNAWWWSHLVVPHWLLFTVMSSKNCRKRENLDASNLLWLLFVVESWWRWIYCKRGKKNLAFKNRHFYSLQIHTHTHTHSIC